MSEAADSVLSSLALCNGSETDLVSKIKGCTALIESRAAASTGLAIAYNNRGTAFVVQGQYDLAIADYDRALALDPTYAKAFSNRGVAFERQHDDDRALQNFEAAIELDHDYANAFAGRAEILAKKRKYDQAIADYDTALRLKPTLGEAWNGRCLARAEIGDVEGAMKDCDASLRIAVTAAALDSRGFVHLKAHEWTLAVQDYDAALRLQPLLASSLYGKSLARAKLGDASGAKTDLQRATTIDADIAAHFPAR